MPVDSSHGEKEENRAPGVRALPLGFDQIVGSAPGFRAALAIAAKASRTRSPMLLIGEAGTGRDMLAQAIHIASHRARLPLQTIDCRGLAQLPEGTGGSLFLDHVDALDPALHDALLRHVLARRRTGATHIFAGATSDPASLPPALAEQLSAVRIIIPPLRDRASDIPPLARHLLARLARQQGSGGISITDDALDRLMQHGWPGNVAELGEVLAVAVAKAGQAAMITAADLPPLAPSGLTAQRRQIDHAGGVALFDDAGHLRTLNAIEADVIRLAIGHYRGRMSEVARRLGIGRSTLYRKLAELGIDVAG